MGRSSTDGAGSRPGRGVSLRAAAGLVALQGLSLGVYAVLELAHLASDRLVVGLTTAAFFAALGAALLFCAGGLARVQSWARSPVVVTELIELLTAWSFHGGATEVVAVALSVHAALVLLLVLNPASTAAFAADPG